MSNFHSNCPPPKKDNKKIVCQIQFSHRKRLHQHMHACTQAQTHVQYDKKKVYVCWGDYIRKQW